MPDSPSADDPPSSEPRARRADARRNVEAILAAAARLLPDQPRASMQDVAQAAGVHRATVHRHFPSRDDLLAALRRHALDQVLELMGDPRLEDMPPREALEHLTLETVRLGNRSRTWRVLPAYDDISDSRAEDLSRPLRRIIERAQASGDVRPDVSVDLLMSDWGGLVISIVPLVAGGRIGLEDAAAHVCHMLGAPPRG